MFLVKFTNTYPPISKTWNHSAYSAFKSLMGFQTQEYLYLLLETYEHLPADKQDLEPADNNKQVCRKIPTIDTHPP